MFCGCFVCLFVVFSLGHCIVCPTSFYSCLLPLEFLYTFVLSKNSTLKEANIRDVRNTIYKHAFELYGVQLTNKYSSCPVYNIQPSIQVQYTYIRDVRCTIYKQVLQYSLIVLSKVNYISLLDMRRFNRITYEQTQPF